MLAPNIRKRREKKKKNFALNMILTLVKQPFRLIHFVMHAVEGWFGGKAYNAYQFYGFGISITCCRLIRHKYHLDCVLVRGFFVLLLSCLHCSKMNEPKNPNGAWAPT